MQPQTPSPTVRPLRRGHDRKIAGVCSGIADYFRVDPTLVRVLFIGGLFLGAGSLLVYVAAWVLMPAPEPVVLPLTHNEQAAGPAPWPTPAQPSAPTSAPAANPLGEPAPGPWAAASNPVVGLPATGTDGPKG